MKDCLFCSYNALSLIDETPLAYAIRDGFPVTPYHTLIIPKRHAIDYFLLSSEEMYECNALLVRIKDEILSLDDSVTGFNIGMNCGASAGQTIFHCHIHLIPRREGDVENPKGGIRHLIPGKGYY